MSTLDALLAREDSKGLPPRCLQTASGYPPIVSLLKDVL